MERNLAVSACRVGERGAQGGEPARGQDPGGLTWECKRGSVALFCAWSRGLVCRQQAVGKVPFSKTLQVTYQYCREAPPLLLLVFFLTIKLCQEKVIQLKIHH